MSSINDTLDNVRKPRIHIKYEVETDGATEEKELPFVVGVMGDFQGNKDAASRGLPPCAGEWMLAGWAGLLRVGVVDTAGVDTTGVDTAGGRGRDADSPCLRDSIMV